MLELKWKRTATKAIIGINGYVSICSLAVFKKLDQEIMNPSTGVKKRQKKILLVHFGFINVLLSLDTVTHIILIRLPGNHS